MDFAPSSPTSEDGKLARLCGEQGEDGVVDVMPGLQLYVRQLPFYSSLVVTHKGGTVWPSSEILGRFLALGLAERLRDIPVVELGCGVGVVPGCVAAHFGAKVTVTDLAEVVPLASQNAQANGLKLASVALPWGSQVPQMLAAGDTELVLASDVLYDSGEHEAVATTITDLLSPTGIVLIASQERTAADGAFFLMLRAQGWATSRLDIEDVFDVSGSSSAFRSAMVVRICWRGDGPLPSWCGLESRLVPDTFEPSDARSDYADCQSVFGELPDLDDPPFAPGEID